MTKAKIHDKLKSARPVGAVKALTRATGLPGRPEFEGSPFNYLG